MLQLLPLSHGPARARLLVLLLMAVALSAALLLRGPMPADASVESRLDSTRGKIDQANQKRGVLTDEISGLSKRIKGYEVQVAALRSQEQQVAARLAEKQSQLDTAQSEVKAAQKELDQLAARLKRSLDILRDRLVAIYQAGPTDLTGLVLTAENYGDLLERSTYIAQINSQDDRVVGRVRDLRDAQRETVAKLAAARDTIKASRDGIAAEKQNLETARTAVETEQGRLASARSDRRDMLGRIDSEVDHLEDIEADLQAKIEAQVAAAAGAGALPAGPMTAPSAAGLIWPVSGTVTSGFGGRSSPGGVGSTNHQGIDIAVPEGTPVRAAKSGTVIMASYNGGYGNYTCVDHGGGLSTCYAHQSSFAVSSGQRVSRGQVIGYSGNTGASTGPHLHFEVRVNGVAYDPMPYL